MRKLHEIGEVELHNRPTAVVMLQAQENVESRESTKDREWAKIRSTNIRRHGSLQIVRGLDVLVGEKFLLSAWVPGRAASQTAAGSRYIEISGLSKRGRPGIVG